MSFASDVVKDGIKNTIREELAAIAIVDEQAVVGDEAVVLEPPKKKSFLEDLLGDNDAKDAALLDELVEYDRVKPSLISDNPLKWWRDHEKILPRLAKLARRYLSACATSASSERLFSAFGLVYEQRRMSLARETANAIIFLHENDK